MSVVPMPNAVSVAQTLGRPIPVDAAFQDIYDGEVDDQAKRCHVDPYTSALAAALVRRVNRAVAMRNLPLAVLQDESGATRLGPTDPEVRRLEAPYRKVAVG